MGLWPCLFRRAKELRAYRHFPPPLHPAPLLFALALARMAPEGPSYQEKTVPELQMLELVARLGAQKSGDSGSAPCPGCKTPLQAHYCGSLGLSFPTGSSSTTPHRAGCLSCPGMYVTSLVAGPMLPLGDPLVLCRPAGAKNQARSGEGTEEWSPCALTPSATGSPIHALNTSCTACQLSTRHWSRVANGTDVTPAPRSLRSGGKEKPKHLIQIITLLKLWGATTGRRGLFFTEGGHTAGPVPASEASQRKASSRLQHATTTNMLCDLSPAPSVPGSQSPPGQ